MVNDEMWMAQAIELAKQAWQEGEIPVGAILVKDEQIIGQGWNRPISSHDPSAHAEMLAIRDAGQKIGNYRLLGATLYVTLEPCSMCAGLLVHSRIQRLVYGASDLKTGACGSVMDLVRHPQLNHQLEVTGGVLAEPCGELLSEFFRWRRAQKKAFKQQQQD
ncbi:tRNA adenosine(34) deaminase TadA [Bowmanella pacifica]|nr:tRNA adenosine(34) deaminase TadA [Bowmanella pacifica]